MNLQASVDLTALPGAVIQQSQQNGKMYLLLPIEDADLLLSDKQHVYLSLALWEKKGGVPDQYGKTHGIKQYLSQARREALGQEGVRNAPFIGSAKPIIPRGQQYNPGASPYVAQPPQGYIPQAAPAPAPAPMTPPPTNNNTNGYPF